MGDPLVLHNYVKIQIISQSNYITLRILWILTLHMSLNLAKTMYSVCHNEDKTCIGGCE